MPPLVTSRSTNTSSILQGRSLPRVNSIKREWAEEDTLPVKDPLKQSQEIDWSSSPERPITKIHKPSNRMEITPMMPEETAADRRRKAIFAAMGGSSSSTSSTNDDRTSKSSSSSTSTLPSAQPPIRSSASINRKPSPQVLPSLDIPTEAKKRQLPWEETMSTAKRVVSTSGPSSRPGSRNSNKGEGKAPALNIKQKMVLSLEQQKVLTLVVQEGKNIFFTGSAGTGKSVLLREIIKSLRKKHATAPDAVAVTASTGIAACNIGGVTLHSFGGAGLAIEAVPVLVGKIKKNKKALARWLRTKVLIIDEVSMVDGDMFDKFCKIGSQLRKNTKPFGGIQIIVTGDFFQLPPVTKGGGQPKFAFEAEMWDEAVHMSVNLTKVFRQKDQKFVDMLNEMRFGRLTPASIAAFRALSRPIYYNDGIEPTELFPRREDVDRSNSTRMSSINTNGYSYVAIDGGAVTDPIQRDKLLSNFMAPQHLEVKENAQVMLIKNVDETLVNGSMGKVIGFCHKPLYISDHNGNWMPDGEIAELGDDDDDRRVKMHKLIESKISAGSKPCPVVQFKVPGGTRDFLVEMDTFKVELPNGEVQASRTQLPLILAWAMSIHKSQGQTLDRVKVDLGKVFEKGQAYVALSRATTLDGLQVTGFSADKVMAHRKVAIWSEKLRDLNV